VSLLLFFIFVTACSQEGAEEASGKITGAVVADVALSTITVRAVDDTGALMLNAVVSVNGKEKGKTSAYGSTKGTKRVVLDGPDNLIKVTKSGYLSVETSVSEILTGEQALTLTLEKMRTSLEITVLEKGVPLFKAEAALYHKNKVLLQAFLTNVNGTVLFPRLNNGNYRLQLEKEDYLPRELTLLINYSRDGETLVRVFELTKIPRLDIVVTNPDGNPLREVEVTLYSKKEYNNPGAFPRHVKYSSAEGKVQFIPLDYEEYVVIFKKSGYRAQLHEKEVTEEDQHLAVEMTLS